MFKQRLSLDRDWKFQLGEITQERPVNHMEYYLSAKAGGGQPVAQENWNDGLWEKVQVPHDWVVGRDFDHSEAIPQGFKPRGKGWYRKKFRLDSEDRGKKLYLQFDGVATHAAVYVNGILLHRNFCGYTSFTVDITDVAHFGERSNTIAVFVDAEAFEGWWYEGAGIYRHVWLMKQSPVHVKPWGLWIKPARRKAGEWDTLVETTVRSSLPEGACEFRLVTSVYSPVNESVAVSTVEGTVYAGEDTVVKQNLPLTHPLLWDVDHPNLYSLETSLYVDGALTDTATSSFGYRTISISADQGFFLNDKPLKLKGTCNHQDHAGIGIALPDAVHEYRIRMLKEMGSNAYRVAHHNPAPELLDACDRLGMLVMDENRNFISSEEGLKQVEAMVIRDRNHPSVIMYSIFNEEPHQGTYTGRRMAQSMRQFIRKLDDTRPVIGAMNGGFLEENGVSDVLDITGFNYMQHQYDEFHQRYPHQPILGSENNCTFSTRGEYRTDAECQVFASYDEDKAEWGQTIRETWQEIHSRDYVMGCFVWTGFDYRGEPSPHRWPSINSHWGVMDTCGFPKDAYYLWKAYWKEEPALHVLPHWTWEGQEGTEIKVMTFTNCEEAELFLNGKSLGRKQVPLYEQTFWMVPYEAGELKAVGYGKGAVIAEDIRRTAGPIARLRLEANRENLLGNGRDAMLVNVYAEDAAGTPVPHADQLVQFRVEGAGTVLGVGNGDPNCHEADKADRRSLFHGCCQAVIGATILTGNESDTLSIQVEIQGSLRSERLTIPVLNGGHIPVPETEELRLINQWLLCQTKFEERPNPHAEINDSDMNSWERIETGNGPQRQLEGLLGFALFRTSITVEEHETEHPVQLYFGKIDGFAEIYINRELRAEKLYSQGNSVTVSLHKEGALPKSGRVEITVMIRGDADISCPGISMSVVLQK
ncbi:beta-galactosidase GalA [Paenibacillus swuensis]|nr:beta-galactosidase GalA [Paenibacillus swuensis]